MKRCVFLPVFLALTTVVASRPSDTEFCRSEWCLGNYDQFKTQIDGEEVCCLVHVHGYMVQNFLVQNGQTASQTCLCKVHFRRIRVDNNFLNPQPIASQTD
ncbi:hypothetical protein RRG08_044573 [Elysia crispata]|uniref:Secreted protein n=1 Tax=Elysia crispata TaxID=231223 RepID=A0AAE0ZTE2_9GAST|nr:hypothetical protein RRG08_044573 [Elysia crispata]